MIIPKDAIIAEEKVRDYLLKPLEEGDKSLFLNRAGYTREEWWELLRDLREQILPVEGTLQRRTRFGERYEVRAILRGPNGRTLPIRTFWENNRIQGWKFITLIPDKSR
ncbi:MAG TPA: hypothetical protein VGM92_15585 [Candidatus Kapabacteria bacterium]|jgi:hypothetical protein